MSMRRKILSFWQEVFPQGGMHYLTDQCFFLQYPGKNQFQTDKVMMPIIHTSIIGIMEIYQGKEKNQGKNEKNNMKTSKITVFDFMRA